MAERLVTISTENVSRIKTEGPFALVRDDGTVAPIKLTALEFGFLFYLVTASG